MCGLRRPAEIAPGDLVRIDIETCPACDGAMRIIACIEDPDVIEKILTDLDGKAPESEAIRRGRRWEELRGLTPICAPIGERKRPA